MAQARRGADAGGEIQQQAAWSPDGRWTALSDRPGPLPKSPADKKQLYVMPADGGEAQQMGVFEKGANSFDWAPDSKSLAVAAEIPEPKGMKDRKEAFGDYHVIHADYGMVQLWRIALPSIDSAGRVGPVAAPVAITRGEDFSVDAFAWSPDGKTIAFPPSATRSDLPHKVDHTVGLADLR